MSSLPYDLLIFGASCRAAAFSALRCGIRPFCADYFADRDLAAVCSAERIDPHHAAVQFTALADSLPPSPWFYTGGFENHPEWVAHIARRHRLWGVDAETLRAVRDPIRVTDVLHQKGMSAPAVRRECDGLPRDGTWLVKPLGSAGGRGIEPLTADNDNQPPSCYFQERIPGPSFSALFIGEKSEGRLIGVTRQLVGILGSPFAYRGSIGPVSIAENLAAKLHELGDVLTSEFALIGWFGVDYILGDGNPWPVEINPRYPASLEIHELASRRALLADHRHACGGDAASDAPAAGAGLSHSPVIAKVVIYASRTLTFPEIALEEHESDDLFAVRSIADIPSPGSRIEPGEPVMTLLASGANMAVCRSRLTGLERNWMSRLGMVGAHRSTEP